MISSYPSIYAVGHRYIADLFDGEIVIEEKIDGSQFSFGVIDGKLRMRSKGQEIYPEAPEKMFAKAVETVLRIENKLVPGWIYRCEYLQKPKHNTLEYARVPASHLILFDIQVPGEHYFSPAAKQSTVSILGLECVECFYHGDGAHIDPQSLRGWFDRESALGGVKIEGVVVKNYGKFGPDKKILIGKFVSDVFKEKHAGEWKKSNPTKSDIVEFIIGQLNTEARWRKAVQHLREAGQLTETPTDIGLLLKEIKEDTEREEAFEIKEVLFKHFWPQIARGITRGFPEFYKKEIGILT